MAAEARITGPKAEGLRDKYLQILKNKGLFDKYTVEVNGKIEVWNVEENGISLLDSGVTLVEIPTFLKDPEEILALVTAGEKKVFATTIGVLKTLGSVLGDVF